MTTILKAVQEIEARAGATTPPATTPRDEPPATASHVLTRVLIALSVGVAIGVAAMVMRSAPSTPAPDEVAREPRAAAPAAAGPPRDAVARQEAPWGRVDKKTAAAHEPLRAAAAEPPPYGDAPVASEPASAYPEPPTAAPPSRRADAPAAAERPSRSADTPVAALAPSRRVDAPVATEPPRRGDTPVRRDTRANANPGRAAGTRGSSGWTPAGVRVEVTAIDYVENADERTAALRIGGRPVTVHQGESVSGLEVQLILPKAVYLRSGRDIFAVDAPQ